MKSQYFFLLVCFLFGLKSIAQDSTISATHKPIYTIVEEMPHYPNGEKALRDTFAKYLQYPTFEKENNIQGTVILKFVVTETGAIEELKVLKSRSKGLDEEALRLMQIIPSFIPGRQQGKLVNVAYVLPVMFKLPKD